MTSEYHFFTEWRVTATLDEVKDVLRDGLALPQWWPAAYLSVAPIEDGDADGVGRVIAIHAKGWLPYTLTWNLHITEPITDTGFALRATGDLDGHGRWTFDQQGADVYITYDWYVTATKPLLRRLAWLLRPAFAANHRWAMAKGEESLQLEVQRRRAETTAAAEAIPAPPPPTFRRLLRTPRR